eukprot:CAMPEP_0115043328 /NCGR_PEP_ID=MMETSP0216-20121206/46807_1 /TAXON_ID=223996 /ORGANISM="Protocruzia adherens, Strain Boccale" /LENGTH=135 /DNA_ID=CAMNT_0002425635 /DNA_START=222 /DNA_END=629 /DNA_ORIENTATION=+
METCDSQFVQLENQYNDLNTVDISPKNPEISSKIPGLRDGLQQCHKKMQGLIEQKGAHQLHLSTLCDKWRGCAKEFLDEKRRVVMLLEVVSQSTAYHLSDDFDAESDNELPQYREEYAVDGVTTGAATEEAMKLD